MRFRVRVRVRVRWFSVGAPGSLGAFRSLWVPPPGPGPSPGPKEYENREPRAQSIHKVFII